MFLPLPFYHLCLSFIPSLRLPLFFSLLCPFLSAILVSRMSLFFPYTFHSPVLSSPLSFFLFLSYRCHRHARIAQCKNRVGKHCESRHRMFRHHVATRKHQLISEKVQPSLIIYSMTMTRMQWWIKKMWCTSWYETHSEVFRIMSSIIVSLLPSFLSVLESVLLHNGSIH